MDIDAKIRQAHLLVSRNPGSAEYAKTLKRLETERDDMIALGTYVPSDEPEIIISEDEIKELQTRKEKLTRLLAKYKDDPDVRQDVEEELAEINEKLQPAVKAESVTITPEPEPVKLGVKHYHSPVVNERCSWDMDKKIVVFERGARYTEQELIVLHETKTSRKNLQLIHELKTAFALEISPELEKTLPWDDMGQHHEPTRKLVTC